MINLLTPYLKSTVLVESIMDQKSNNRFGTSFFFLYKHKTYLVTNTHIINQAHEIYVYVMLLNKISNTEKAYKLKLNSEGTIYHSKYDLCVLNVTDEIKEDSDFKIIFTPINSSKIPSDYAMFNSLTQLYMIGYPNIIRDITNGYPVVKSGISSTLLSVNYDNDEEFLADISAVNGNSGSPVFTIYNNQIYFVGINYQSFDYIKKSNNTSILLPTGITRIIKASVLLEMVSKPDF